MTRFCDAVLAAEPAVRPYTRNYIQGHVRALGRIYPRVAEQLGEERFRALAAVYTRHYGASHWDLNLYGERFPELVAAQVHGGKSAEVDWQRLARLAEKEYASCRASYPDADQTQIGGVD